MAVSSGYWTTWGTTVNKSIGAVTSREIFVQAHHARARETGYVHGARFFFGDVTGLTSVTIKIWRGNAAGTAFNLVGESSNLVSLISAGTVNDLRFATPIFVEEGDHVAIRLVGSADGTNQLVLEASTNAQILEVTNSTPGANFAWLSQSATSGLLKIQLLSSSPSRVCWLGYSIFAGSTAHTAFCTQTTTATDISSTNIKSTIAYRFSQAVQLPYQNMGIGSQTAADLVTRVVGDVIAADCNLVMLMAGGNDALTSVSVASYISSMTTILNLFRQHGISVCVYSVPPGTAFTRAQATLIDGYNAALPALVAGYANAVYCDVTELLGQTRADGPAGNRWDMRTEFNAGDGLHYTAGAHRRIALAGVAAVRPFRLTPDRG